MLDLAAASVGAAGSSRFLSRSLMNASYSAVPGRGGASRGKPPAHCGIASLTPAASFSLMVPQPPSPHAGSVTARTMARWRVRTGIFSNVVALRSDLRRERISRTDLPPSCGAAAFSRQSVFLSMEIGLFKGRYFDTEGNPWP